MTTDHRNGSSAPEPLSASLFGEFRARIPAMHAEMERLEGERHELIERHQAQLAVIDDQKKQLRALLRALGEDEPARKAPLKASKPKAVSDRILLALLGAILERGDDELFTSLDIHEQVASWSTPGTYQGFDYFRSLEVIGRAGKDKASGREQWRIMPGGRDIALRFRETLIPTTPPTTPRRSSSATTNAFLLRVKKAIAELGTPEFTILAVNDVLGLTSPRNTYSAMKYLRELGYIELARKEEGRSGKTWYRIKDAAALDQLNLEATNA